ncbi:MAG: uroporphyrinogen-III C-methyltransferase [Luteitalea sp.]|nr:uroporphyrinogen-III C-methyltransferase [Luteitalea sp.]
MTTDQPATPSIVYLIGAGPGDPGLITVRGLECLASADVVLYDHLVHPQLLRHARADAETIDVGRAAPQAIEQEAICYLIAEKAREGKTVARLKWGDPFVFDRGGSEALFLHEQGVRFEVVPGIPAAIGAASYAGIPLTYPGGGDTLTFVRGNEDDGKTRPVVDWRALARLDGTIVCYASASQIPHILTELMSHGRSDDDPAALIYDGTLPTQKTVAGSLREIERALAHAPQPQPSFLVVGRVTALREHLRWYDSRPLFGKRILITRQKEPAGELAQLLGSLGAQTIEAPMIRILPPLDFAPLDAACSRAGEFDWIVFASANAVDSFMTRLLASSLDVRALHAVQLCAIGQGTADRLARYGLKVDVVPAESRAEAVADAIAGLAPIAGLSVLLPRGDIGRQVIADELRRRGAVVAEAIAYRTVLVDHEREGPDVYRLLLERSIDVVTFTSPSAVRSFVSTIGAEPAADLLRPTVVAAIGPVTAEAALQYGIETTIVPAQYNVQALADAIVRHFERPS